MKKLVTLLLAMGVLASLHAQNREETRRVILGEPRDNGGYSGRDDRGVVYGRNGNDRYPDVYSNNRRNGIDRVNRDYSRKINSIRNNPHLSNAEKERTIRQLERDRRQQLDRMNRKNNRDRRYEENDRYSRSDNGKHKGWYKKAKNKNWRNGRNRD